MVQSQLDEVALRWRTLAKKLLCAAVPRAPTSRQRKRLGFWLYFYSASRRAIDLSRAQTLPHVAAITRIAMQPVFTSRALIPVLLPLLPSSEKDGPCRFFLPSESTH